jgi:hypothetical protein
MVCAFRNRTTAFASFLHGDFHGIIQLFQRNYITGDHSDHRELPTCLCDDVHPIVWNKNDFLSRLDESRFLIAFFKGMLRG